MNKTLDRNNRTLENLSRLLPSGANENKARRSIARQVVDVGFYNMGSTDETRLYIAVDARGAAKATIDPPTTPDRADAFTISELARVVFDASLIADPKGDEGEEMDELTRLIAVSLASPAEVAATSRRFLGATFFD